MDIKTCSKVRGNVTLTLCKLIFTYEVLLVCTRVCSVVEASSVVKLYTFLTSPLIRLPSGPVGEGDCKTSVHISEPNWVRIIAHHSDCYIIGGSRTEK